MQDLLLGLAIVFYNVFFLLGVRSVMPYHHKMKMIVSFKMKFKGGLVDWGLAVSTNVGVA